MFLNFINLLNFSLIHYIGSQIIPQDFSHLNINNFINLTENYLNSQKKLKDSDTICQILILLIDISIQKPNLSDTIIQKILEIIPKLPTKFAAMIFFNRLNIFMKKPSNHVLKILINLLTKIQSGSLLLYAIKMFENCPYVSKIDFNSSNIFYKIFQNPKSTLKKVRYAISSIAFIHQRTLISATKIFLTSQQYIPLIDHSSNTVFNYFLSYFQFLFNQCDIVLHSLNNPNEIEDNFILHSFYNFICLLSNLIEFYNVARHVLAILSITFASFSQIIKKFNIKLENQPFFDDLILKSLDLFSRFSSILICGSEFSSIENDFFDLIKYNLENNFPKYEEMISQNFNNFSNPQLRLFLEDGKDIMSFYYSKVRQAFNKKLTPEIQFLDKISLAAFCHHTNSLEHLFSKDLQIRKQLDQMFKIRNDYLSFIQQKSRRTS
jgi:hypothetical protein